MQSMRRKTSCWWKNRRKNPDLFRAAAWRMDAQCVSMAMSVKTVLDIDFRARVRNRAFMMAMEGTVALKRERMSGLFVFTLFWTVLKSLLGCFILIFLGCYACCSAESSIGVRVCRGKGDFKNWKRYNVLGGNSRRWRPSLFWSSC